MEQSDSKLLVRLVNTGTRKSESQLQKSMRASLRYKEKTAKAIRAAMSRANIVITCYGEDWLSATRTRTRDEGY